MLRFHNTLSGKLEDFEPLEEGKVKFYMCGPTVWDFAHIGNFRSFTFADVLQRYLRFKGYSVTYVMNLTDVDDRIINESNKKGVTIQEMTEPFTVAFNEDMAALGNQTPDVQPKATEHIPEMIEIIQKLLDNGRAYESDGSIYFRITEFPDYGKLSKINFEGNLEGGSKRVDTDKYDKEDARDFALWKLVGEDETPGWDAPFGRGRPGWHIECSAMSMKYLGTTFDIHAGGVDLQFPHHENEIAQSEGSTGKLFSKYWLHGEFLKIDNDTMSKSLGNAYTFRDMKERGFSPLAIRYLLISVPYRRQLNFTFDGLKGAETAVERLQQFRRLVREANAENGSDKRVKSLIETSLQEFENSLDDDLNTSQALAAIHNLVREVNTILTGEGLRSDDQKAILDAINTFDLILGIFGVEQLDEHFLSKSDKDKFERYKNARKNRDYSTSDEIRNNFLSKDIRIEDTKQKSRIIFDKQHEYITNRIVEILNNFDEQRISGNFFGITNEITLPKFVRVIPESNKENKFASLDIIGDGNEEDWFVEVKFIKGNKSTLKIINEIKKQYEYISNNSLPNSIFWVTIFGETNHKLKEELSKLGIYYSDMKNIEQIERFLND